MLLKAEEKVPEGERGRGVDSVVERRDDSRGEGREEVMGSRGQVEAFEKDNRVVVSGVGEGRKSRSEGGREEDKEM